MSKSKAIAAVISNQKGLFKAQGTVTMWSLKRDAAVLAAQAEGASYAELEAATGLSTARITQILRRARTATTTD